MSDKSEYLKNYKKYHYKKTRKIVTVPLLIEEFETLKNQADKMGVKTNKLAKEILLAHTQNKKPSLDTTQQKELIREYMRISRGIATNINQIAHSSNMGDTIDINVLINSLKAYEDEFKKLIKSLL
ncbi:MAG: plasmid mobilization relaxosome protein MobC [Campylobacterota bacterium]|nr:plasmid mobilization relaxosome protein MobC [Campylobacterota bacterium]